LGPIDSSKVCISRPEDNVNVFTWCHESKTFVTVWKIAHFLHLVFLLYFFALRIFRRSKCFLCTRISVMYTGTTAIFVCKGINPFFIMDYGTRYVTLKPGLWGIEFLNRAISSKIAIITNSFQISKYIFYKKKKMVLFILSYNNN